MGAWTAVMLLPLGLLGAGKESYEAARDRAEADGRPLVVLIGAPWCPGCRTMKQSTMPRLEKSGKLDKVVYTEVDSDEQPKLAAKLMRGNSIPQLIVFYKDASGWRRGQLTGAQSPGQIESLLNKAVAEQVATKAEGDSEAVVANGQ